MRILTLALLFASACTKHNPNVCCTDEADCNANGIPVGSTCAQGLVCRGNQCIAENCSSSADCDPAAPYCTTGTCAETCSDDAECPGYDADASLRFCVSGACVACRTSDECSTTLPICESNACRGCATDDECPSRACDVDTGACIDASSVLYADPSGTDLADCSLATPCSITHAISSVTALRHTIRMLPGTYPSYLDLSAGGSAMIIGVGATITDPAAGFGGVHISNGMDVTLRGVTVQATYAVFCENTAGATALTVRAGTLFGTQYPLRLNSCHAFIDRAVVNGGAQGLVVYQSSILVVDRSVLNTNLNVTNGNGATVTVTNSIFAHVSTGTTPNTTIDIAFSSSKYNAFCPYSGTTLLLRYTNDVFVNNAATAGNNILMADSMSPPCFDHDIEYPQAMALGTNMIFADPKVVDYMNDDFHLTATSPAINGADPAAVDTHDFDGVARPQGVGPDLGAFEFH